MSASQTDSQSLRSPVPRVRRPMSLGFWLALGLGLVLILSGLAFWRLAPSLGKTPASVASVSGADDPATLKARIRELEQELARARATPQPPLESIGRGDAAALSTRLDRVEAEQTRMRTAAAAAMAAAGLADAAQTSRPFEDELAALKRLAPSAADLAALDPIARTGAPTRAALASEFSDVAAHAANALHAPGDRASFLSRTFAAIGGLVTIRRVGDLAGRTPDAALARAEQRVGEGDLEGALEQIDHLPPAGRAAVAAWRERAQRRIELDRRIASMRAGALAALAASPQEAPAP